MTNCMINYIAFDNNSNTIANTTVMFTMTNTEMSPPSLYPPSTTSK